MWFHFLNTFLMTSAFKVGRQKSINDFLRFLDRSEARTKAQHVGIVMFAGEASHFFVEHQRSTNARNFVGSNTHSHPAATNQNSNLTAPVGNILRDALGVI